MGLIVNLDEFAGLVGVSPETMKTHIREIEGEPDWLIKRGTRGSSYEIEAEGGVAWWQAKRDATDLADAARKQALQQMRFDLIGGAVEDGETLALSGKQRSDEYSAAMDAIKFRRLMGNLLEYSDMQHHLTIAVVDLRRRLQLVPGEFVVGQGLDAKYIEPLKVLIGRALDDFVTSITLPAPVDVDRG